MLNKKSVKELHIFMFSVHQFIFTKCFHFNAMSNVVTLSIFNKKKVDKKVVLAFFNCINSC